MVNDERRPVIQEGYIYDSTEEQFDRQAGLVPAGCVVLDTKKVYDVLEKLRKHIATVLGLHFRTRAL